MPEYINTSRKGSSYSNGKLYRAGDIAILSKEYADKKTNSWKLFDDYKKEQLEAREASALKETPAETIKRLNKELKAAKAADAKTRKNEETIPNLVKEAQKAEAPKKVEGAK
jgi:hypothetical protein